ncbi:MAG: hypothetical protein ACM3VT_21785 [Solirubrobacterales bacterium]
MSADDASSDEWFVRYLFDAVLLVVLVLAAIGVSWYLDSSQYFRDWNQEPGAVFLVCMVLCPVLAIVTLCLAIYAVIRLFLRPRSFSHSLIRLTLLVAHVFVFLVCTDTISSTVNGLAGGVRQLSSGQGMSLSLNGVQGRDFSSSEYDGREGSPDDSSSYPSGLGPGPAGPSMPGRGAGSR